VLSFVLDVANKFVGLRQQADEDAAKVRRAVEDVERGEVKAAQGLRQNVEREHDKALADLNLFGVMTEIAAQINWRVGSNTLGIFTKNYGQGPEMISTFILNEIEGDRTFSVQLVTTKSGTEVRCGGQQLSLWRARHAWKLAELVLHGYTSSSLRTRIREPRNSKPEYQ
jgi:hypothetical protein